jgi:beta-mannosidase
MQTTRRTLSDGWRVREVPTANVSGSAHLPWLPAQVPGHVHLDLLRAGVIPDPFARMHERDVAWVDDTDWEYETTFHVEDPAPSHAYLRFHGLDTVAEITLNGEALGQTDNMFIPHEFSVDGRLRAGLGDAGLNTLRIIFRSAKQTGTARQNAWDAALEAVPLRWDSWGGAPFVRKAQYMSGWDWGPILIGCGVWQPVELVVVPTARILDWKYDVTFNADETATVTVTAEVERSPLAVDAPLELTANVLHIKREDYSDWDEFGGSIGGHSEEDVDVEPFKVAVPPGSGRQTVTGSLIIDDPVLWQPNGYTEDSEEGPACYLLSIQLQGGGDDDQSESLDWRVKYIGLRTIELLHEPDADGQGEGFKFRVNGHDLFIKGANWIPDDSFPATITRKKLEDRITQARDAGFNMLRIWGGGLYESEDFYDLCDQMGILVWQDFPYACAYYPDTGEYAEKSRVEAIAAVRRIRNHPSLALWCGNNENAMMYYSNWGGARPDRYLGEHLYNDVLPFVVAAEDPQTPYWPSSPFGGEDPNSATHGDCHNWDVWHGRGDWVHYTENDSRFCSEFGFASSCGLAAWDTVLADADRHPLSPVVRWHDKTRKGYDTYLGYIGLHYPAPQTMEDLVYYSQINQAEALKYGIEHYRRRKGHCWGTLVWQLNDCWPVQSWAMIDYLGEPKASMYAAKKFYAPVLVSLVRDGETVTAHIVNDHLHAVAGTLALTLGAMDGGAPLAQTTHEVQVGPNGAEAVATFSLTTATGRERELYVHARFQPGTDGQPVENLLLLAEPKDLRLAMPGLTLDIQKRSTDGAFVLTLTTQRFAPYVWLRRHDNVPLPLDDNFFHLLPGETRQIIAASSDDIETVEEMRGLLAVRTL